MNILSQYTNINQTIATNSSNGKTGSKVCKNPNSTTKTSIFYVNDIHGQVPKMQRLVSAAEHAEIAAKNNGADILKLCSGDTFIGADNKRDTVAASFLNIAEFDAQTLGNHEFDITASICGKLLKNTNPKIVGANLNFPDNNSELSKKVIRSTIAEGENGDKYGLIGIQPPDMSERLKKKEVLEGITIDNYDETLNEIRREVEKLKSQNINKIILLSHSGNDFERKIAQSVDGIDVILGGHSHDLVEGVKNQENLFYSPSGEPVIITQAGRDGNHFGVLNIEFNDKGQLTYIQNNVNDTNVYSPNMIMTKEADRILGTSPKIGVLKDSDPTPKNYLIEENAWADFVADALKEELDAEVVLVNSANFRGSVDKGDITERDINSIFPFNNKMAKVKLSEKDLVDAIKLCGKTLSNEHHKPGILQVSGLSYTLDSTGNLKELYFIDKQKNKHQINVENPDPNKIYTAVYDEFLLGGGDNLEMLKRKDSDIIEKYDFEKGDVTINYIKKIGKPFEVRKDNRIIIES